jgi:hypothetical protein
MSGSKHMVRVLRAELVDGDVHTTAKSTRIRTVLLASLTFCVICLVVASIMPQLPHTLALLQGRLSLSQYFFG